MYALISLYLQFNKVNDKFKSKPHKTYSSLKNKCTSTYQFTDAQTQHTDVSTHRAIKRMAQHNTQQYKDFSCLFLKQKSIKSTKIPFLSRTNIFTV